MNTTENVAEIIGENVAENIAENTTENVAENTAKNTTENIAENTTENTTESVAENTTENAENPTAIFYMEAGERIRQMRSIRGYTREQLADAASVSPKFLYEIEKGRKGFSAVILHNISKALEIDCDYILTGSNKIPHDRRLTDTLQLFNEEQSGCINSILRQIYELL